MTHFTLPVNQIKVLDMTIDTYLWLSDHLNTSEVRCLGQHLVSLADRRASDVEATYYSNRQLAYEAGIGYTEEPDHARD